VAVGIGLALSIVFLPIGTVIGFLGLFLLVEGILAHIERPLRLADLVDAMIGLAGAAIALTFALAVVFFLVSFGAGTIAGVIEWLREAL
jgi:divalent metal cation (Fe/Co/Zn/Cd) transporter